MSNSATNSKTPEEKIKELIDNYNTVKQFIPPDRYKQIWLNIQQKILELEFENDNKDD